METAKTLLALESMCMMWRSVCIAHGWEPEHMREYNNARRLIEQQRKD